MIHVVWLPPDNQWDQHTFELLFSKKLWHPIGSYDFEHHKSFDDLPKTDGIVLVVPHKYYVDKVDWLNKQIKPFKWVLYIGTGNEEGEFPVDKIEHPNKVVYYTTPHMQNTPFEAIDRLFGDGFAPQSECVADYTKLVYDKPLDLYFAGQITHSRREQAIKAIKHIAEETDLKAEYLTSQAFTQGYDDYHTYYKKLASAKIAPCPSGPATPDTFRTYEALEAMALPILDSRTPADGQATDYWTRLFGEEPPMPIITDEWESLNGYAHDALEDWHTHINRAVAWWIGKKRQYAYNLVEDLNKLGVADSTARDVTTESITVLIPSSPVPSNPDTAFIEKTIADVRKQLPDCEIILMIDGLREEQADRKAVYDEYKKRVIWNCLHLWHNVLPIVFDEHQHQANMTRQALDYVKTPTILFVEHDAPLTPDFSFEWPQLVESITNGEAYVIRFHFEGSIPDAHRHLMLGEPEEINGVKMIRTTQWSQRPHLASTAFYRQMIDTYYGADSRTMIEDVIHGVVTQYYDNEGMMGWHLFKLWIYHPDGGNIKRSYHIDARGKDPKYGMKIAYTGETPRFAPSPKTTGDEAGK